jgi:hypothetical protein
MPKLSLAGLAMEESPNLQRRSLQRASADATHISQRTSMLNIARMTLAVGFAGASRSCSVRSLQMAAQTHVQRDCNGHHDQRTYAQDQEPPDHPHSRLG